MGGKAAVTQERAERAEELLLFAQAAGADGWSADEHRELLLRVGTVVSDWGQQTLELSFVQAFLGGGLPAQDNTFSRTRRLQREAGRSGEVWTCPVAMEGTV